MGKTSVYKLSDNLFRSRKSLIFNLNGSLYRIEPVKIEQNKLNDYCKTFLSNENEYEAVKLEEETIGVEKSILKAVKEDGRDAPLIQSSYDITILLNKKVTKDFILDYNITSFYELADEDIAENIGECIYMFDYCHRACYEPLTAFILTNEGITFMLTGYKKNKAKIKMTFLDGKQKRDIKYFKTKPEAKPKKNITFFFIVENSFFMQGLGLDTINTVLENYIKMLQYYSEVNPEISVKVAILEFEDEANWVTEKPFAVEGYIWSPIQSKYYNFKIKDRNLPLNTGNVSYRSAFHELNRKLSKNLFMDSPEDELPPVIMFFTGNRSFKDSEDDLLESIVQLSKNNWDKNALKIAFAMGRNPDPEILEKWTGKGFTILVKNPEMMIDNAAVIGRLCMQIVMNSTVVNIKDSNEETLNRRNKFKTYLNEVLYNVPPSAITLMQELLDEKEGWLKE